MKFLFTFLVLFFSALASSQAGAAECTSGVLANVEIECYVDTPGYDTYSTDYCYGEITGSSYAYFRLTAGSQSLFGDSTSPTFDGWASCTSIAGSGYSSVCEKSIGILHTVIGQAIMTPYGGGTSCTKSAIAEAEAPE